MWKNSKPMEIIKSNRLTMVATPTTTTTSTSPLPPLPAAPPQQTVEQLIKERDQWKERAMEIEAKYKDLESKYLALCLQINDESGQDTPKYNNETTPKRQQFSINLTEPEEIIAEEETCEYPVEEVKVTYVVKTTPKVNVNFDDDEFCDICIEE